MKPSLSKAHTHLCLIRRSISGLMFDDSLSLRTRQLALKEIKFDVERNLLSFQGLEADDPAWVSLLSEPREKIP